MKHILEYQHHAEYKLVKKVCDGMMENDEPLLNSIHAGCHILQLRKQELWTQRAFCLYPIFQPDDLFVDKGLEYIQYTGADYSVTCALEYRGIVNSTDIRKSPLPDVNEMLIANKVQGRKYVEKRYPEDNIILVYYQWLKLLEVDETAYQEYVKELDTNWYENALDYSE